MSILPVPLLANIIIATFIMCITLSYKSRSYTTFVCIIVKLAVFNVY